jgi:hypothetical protein
MNNLNGIKLKCNFCTDAELTDELYLVTIGKKDYLLCEDHKNQYDHLKEKEHNE